MTKLEDLLARKVSYQESAWALPTSEFSLKEVLDNIRRGKYSKQIDHLRALICRGEREQYGVDKKRLPGVTFSGTFNGKRRIEKIKNYTNLLVLDIDHVPQEELSTIGSALKTDIHVMACWMSPSGEGLKGLLDLSFSEELSELSYEVKHRCAFESASNYFNQAYNICLDGSGSDITRLCFLSSDSELHFRPDYSPFKVVKIPESLQPSEAKPLQRRSVNSSSKSKENIKKHLLNYTEGKNEAHDRAAIGSIIKYLEKRKISITASYDKWVRVAFAIASTFTFDVGRNYFLRLCRLDGSAHDEEGSINLLESCYLGGRGQITLGTILHYAHQVGYKAKVRDQH